MSFFLQISAAVISEMKRREEETDSTSESQAKVRYSCELKTVFAKQYLAWKARGGEKHDFLAFLAESDVVITERSLTRWVAGVKQQGKALSQTVGGNRERTLTEEESQLLVGFVLHNNSQQQEVHLETLKNFIFTVFNKEVSISTVHNYLRDLGFSSRVTRGRNSGFQLDSEQMARMAFEWLQVTPLRCPRDCLCSIDFTFTSHRTDRRVSYALVGDPQPSSKVQLARFTNCVVTCVWADGVPRTPSLLFTYNQAFSF
jgi:transposase